MNTNGVTHLKWDKVGFELLFFDSGDDAHDKRDRKLR